MQSKQIIIQPPATPGGPVTIVEAPVGTPQTPQEFTALTRRRGELGDQLAGAKRRRNELREESNVASPAARPAIQARIGELDVRIVRLEGEIDKVSDAIASAPAHVLAPRTETGVDPARIADRVSREIVPLAGIFSVFVLLPLTLVVMRLVWRRTSAPSSAVLADQAANAKRLDQIQQSIDAIAVEVERISEGQRYSAKMMDRALGAGSAEPVAASEKSAPSYLSRP